MVSWETNSWRVNLVGNLPEMLPLLIPSTTKKNQYNICLYYWPTYIPLHWSSILYSLFWDPALSTPNRILCMFPRLYAFMWMVAVWPIDNHFSESLLLVYPHVRINSNSLNYWHTHKSLDTETDIHLHVTCLDTKFTKVE